LVPVQITERFAEAIFRRKTGFFFKVIHELAFMESFKGDVIAFEHPL